MLDRFEQLAAVQTLRTQATLQRLVKILYVFINSPAVWRVSTPVVADYNLPGGLAFLIHLAFVLAVDGMFLVVLNNLERWHEWVDVALTVVMLAVVVGVGIVNREGAIGFLARAGMGVVLITLAIRDSLGQQLRQAREARMARTQAVNPKHARLIEEHEMQRFTAQQEQETRVVVATAEVKADADIAAAQAEASLRGHTAQRQATWRQQAIDGLDEDAVASLQSGMKRQLLEAGAADIEPLTIEPPAAPVTVEPREPRPAPKLPPAPPASPPPHAEERWNTVASTLVDEQMFSPLDITDLCNIEPIEAMQLIKWAVQEGRAYASNVLDDHYIFRAK